MQDRTVNGRRLAEALVALALMAGAFWVGLRMEPRLGTREATSAGASPAVVSLTVRDSSGARVPLAASGEPSVVMISSGRCSYCAISLADMAAISKGEPLTRLRMLTLDGIENGRRMTGQAGTRGVWHAEPDGRSAEAMLALNVPGTPVFLMVDAEGRVRQSMPGYPGREGLRPWVAVMVGDADSLEQQAQVPLETTPVGSTR